MGQLRRAPLTERLAQDLIPDRGGTKPKSPTRLKQKKFQDQNISVMDSTTAKSSSTGGSKKYGRKPSSAAAQRAVFEENFTTRISQPHSKYDTKPKDFEIREDVGHEETDTSIHAQSRNLKTEENNEENTAAPSIRTRSKALVRGPVPPSYVQKSQLSKDRSPKIDLEAVGSVPTRSGILSNHQSSARSSIRSSRRRGHAIAEIAEMMQGMKIDEDLPSVFSESTSGSTFIEHLPPGRNDLVPLVEHSNTKKVQTFHNWAAEIIKFYEINMVGEGAFGQVFKVMDKDDIPPEINQHRVKNIGGCILKVIPIRPEKGEGSRNYRQSTAQEVATEVRLLKKMDEFHGFTRFRDVYVVQGKMNLRFVDAWRTWKSIPSNESEIDPTKSTRNAEKQVWAVIEMDDAGHEVERLRGRVAMCQVYDIFWSLALTLFKAEEEAEFEHRDLHVSNVCVKLREGFTTADTPDTTASPSVLFGRSGFRTTIIDYTLSRALVDPEQPENVAYNVPSDEVFEGQGRTREQTWQFDTYRRMRDAVDLANASETRGRGRRGPLNKWARFVPRTNVVWLAYLLRVLLRRAGMASLSPIDSGVDASLEQDLHRRLEETLGAIGVEEVASVPESAGALISLAVWKGWLGTADVEEWRRLVEAE